MSLNSQFSLSLELTRLVPLGSIFHSTGQHFLNLARDLRNSGSDVVTEAELAEVFGRNRIELRFESSFRTVVKESRTKPINALLDIVLESGAGPTLQRSLNDQKYFSTVIQLSFLTSMLNLQSLAAGLHHAFVRRAEAISTEHFSCPSYDSLLGTLRTIRDQTSAFNWNLLVDAVTASLGSGFHMAATRHSVRTGFSWCLPSAILQGCLDFFAMVQHFPKDRVLRIRTPSGLYWHHLQRLLVVWAHHVLGLTVVLCFANGKAFGKFGPGHGNVILVEQEYGNDSDICLLDGTQQEVFRISESVDDPEIIADTRFHAKDFAAQYLAWMKEDTRAIIIRQAVEYCRSWLSQSHQFCYLERLQKAATFMFGDCSDLFSIESPQPKESMDLHDTKDLILPLGRALFAFTHVESLDGLEELPVTLDALKGLNRKVCNDGREAFEYMAKLLLGNHDMKNAVLVSCQGWCVYTNILALPDPTEVSAPLIRVTRGVPSRAGERKQFIVDGVSLGRIETPCIDDDTPGTAPNASLGCSFDVSNATWLVGSSGLAFEVIIKLELEPSYRKFTDRATSYCRRMYKVGLLELEAIAVRATRLPPCFHAEALIGSGFSVPSGCRVFSSSFNPIPLQHESSESTAVTLSAGNSFARWFCLVHSMEWTKKGLYQAQLSPKQIYLRDKNCCPACCFKFVKDNRQNIDTAEEVKSVAVLIL